MPDFSLLIGDDSSIIYTGKDDDSYEVIFDSGSSGTVTDIKVSMSGGYLLYVKSYQNGRLLYSFETVSYSESYDERIFSDKWKNHSMTSARRSKSIGELSLSRRVI